MKAIKTCPESAWDRINKRVHEEVGEGYHIAPMNQERKEMIRKATDEFTEAVMTNTPVCSEKLFETDGVPVMVTDIAMRMNGIFNDEACIFIGLDCMGEIAININSHTKEIMTEREIKALVAHELGHKDAPAITEAQKYEINRIIVDELGYLPLFWVSMPIEGEFQADDETINQGYGEELISALEKTLRSAREDFLILIGYSTIKRIDRIKKILAERR